MDSAYTANWQGKLREQIDRNPEIAAGIVMLILAAIVLLFTNRSEPREAKPGRIIKIRERIIERPGATTIIERERAPEKKEEKTPEVKEEKKTPEVKEEKKPPEAKPKE